MDNVLPDLCQGATPDEQAYALLLASHTCILAMSTGGCARYAFSTDAHYCLDRRGYPLLNYTSTNPHHHLIMTNSTMDLRLVHRIDKEGNELSLLIVTGMLQLVDPGDHENIDRYARYYEFPTENYSRGSSRLYRFIPDKACFELFSGERINLNPGMIIKKQAMTDKEECQLIDFGNQCFRAQKNIQRPISVAGVDSLGVDIKFGTSIIRKAFPAEIRTIQEIELALTGVNAIDSATF